MPTGYTAAIEDGEIKTGKAFLNSCCKGFGACMGNNLLPLEDNFLNSFNESDYYERILKEAKSNLEKYQTVSDEELQKEIDDKYEKNFISTKKYISDCDEKNLRYKRVKDEVMKWNPPTPEHENLKKFALEQIDMCFPITYEYSIQELSIPKRNVSEYRKSAIECACKEIDRCSKQLIDEADRRKSRAKWVIDFKNSFES